jgi:hypothetical protein
MLGGVGGLPPARKKYRTATVHCSDDRQGD